MDDGKKTSAMLSTSLISNIFCEIAVNTIPQNTAPTIADPPTTAEI